MGSAASNKQRSSQTKHPTSTAVVAEVVVPGQSQPVKVKGHIDSSIDRTAFGAAKLTEVAPNKYKVKIGNQDIGTFDAPSSDFESYLKQAASLTVTNIETVGGDNGDMDFTPGGSPLCIPLIRQTSVSNGVVYSDDEDWENVAESLDRSDPKTPPVPGPSSSLPKEVAKERRAKIKQAIREKKENLSQKDYQQMIANHKQEMELMEILRDREKERHQLKLGSKVAERKKQREARMAEKKEQEKLLNENEDQCSSADEVKELQLALNHRAMQFKDELKDARMKMSSQECQRLIDRHRSEMEEMQKQLDEERDRMRKQLMAKLEARKMRSKGSHADGEDECFLPEELKQLQLAMDIKSTSERQKIASQKNKLSTEKYQQLLDKHHEEMKELEKRLEQEREMSNKKLREKLAARRLQNPPSVEIEKESTTEDMSSQEIERLEREILSKEATFMAEVEKKRSKMSDADYQRLLARHRGEMEALRNKLKLSQARQKQHFQDKLAERRKRRGNLSEGDDQSVSNIVNLEEDIAAREAAFQAAVEGQRGQMSDEEYRRLLEQHQREMDDLREKLKWSQERQRQHFHDKLEERRRRRGMMSHDQERKELFSLIDNEGNHLQEDEIDQIEKEINDYDNLVKSSIAGKRGEVSKAEVNQLLEEHARNMEDFNARMEREKQRMLDSLRAKRAARKFKLESEADFVNIMSILEKNQREDSEALSEEELNDLEEDLKKYSLVIHESLESNRGVFSDEELGLMVSEHRRNMEAMENRLENERLRMDEKMKRRLAMRQANIVSTVASSSEDEDEDEEVGDLPDFGETMANLAATQFWTTPIQSTDVLIVPLAEEYPVKKKCELYTDPSIFRDLDAHAIRLAQTVSLVTQPTFSSLVNELISIAITELEKARVIFRWITAQNCEEMNLNDVVDDTPLGVLKGLYQKKITFSTLFMRMCRFVSLQCVEITGIAKVKGYTPGTEINLQDPSYHHTWNAVRIDGYWHFLDCNWGISHIPGSVTFDPFRFEYDEHYFLADPEVIISSHFPNDSLWQLLRGPISLTDFNNAVLLKPDYFKYRFGLLDHRQAVLQAPEGVIDIRIICPLGFLLSCRLLDAYSGDEKSNQGISLNQYEFIHQVDDNTMACYVRIPNVGAFHLTLFAKRQFIDGQLNVESPTEICRYLIYCRAPSNDRVPLPFSPADHWGPIGVMNAGLLPVSHRSGVIFSQDNQYIHVVFKKTLDISFYHSLTAWGKDETQLRSYVLQRNVHDQLIFTVVPPHPDRYGLHISVIYEGYLKPVHLCSYLIVANSTRPSVQPFPALRGNERWGPTKAFHGLELAHISNLDPFIVTEQSILIIEVGHNHQREFTFHFYHEGRELPGDIQMQPSNQKCSFVVDLRSKGFFVLKIFAKEANYQGIPFTHVFNYLIQKI